VRCALRWTSAACALALAACEGGGTQPGNLRFGQVGRIEAVLEVPLQVDQGLMVQELVWRSSGEWTLREAISYKGQPGDENVRRSPGDPSQYASAYASLITQVNEGPGLSLFVSDLDPAVDPTCGVARTRVRFAIVDDVRGDSIAWTRCANGSFNSLTPRGAAPGETASRVVQAAVLAGEFTLGDGFRGAYLGSVPFATLDRGEDSGTDIPEPRVFTGPEGWTEFWQAHRGAPEAPPPVDFATEMVIVAGVGERPEAGDSVEVRRILQVDGGTVTEVFERVPGDFCSPAARRHTPFHIVVAPRTELPVSFADITVERVPCGR